MEIKNSEYIRKKDNERGKRLARGGPQKREEKGIDFSKDNVYDAIGRSDLKPQPKAEWEDLRERFSNRFPIITRVILNIIKEIQDIK